MVAQIWVNHEALLGPVHLACVDGRCQGNVVGTPGGNLGEFIAVLSAMEAIQTDLTQAQVDAAFHQVMTEFGAFYHHTDGSALERLGPLIPGEGDVESRVRNPPEAFRSTLLDHLVQAEHVGCGHLAAMLREPEHYGVRKGLVEDAIRAFFVALWNGEEGLVYEVLNGAHEERKVVTVVSCGDAGRRCLSVVPGGEDPMFVYHADAARWFRHKVARLVGSTSFVGDGIEDLVARADRKAKRQLEATLETLAATLPRQMLVPCGG